MARGVAAAPEALDPDEWIRLITPDPLSDLAPEMVTALRGTVAGYRAQMARGIFVQPAPAERLIALRKTLAAGGIQGFLVPLADEHQSEFPSQGAQRLAWLTGFSGSAGMAVVLAEQAAIFVDGRYSLQVRDQVDVSHFHVQHITEEPPADWIAANASSGWKIGYDPWLHTVDGLSRLRDGCGRAGATLVPLDPNPLDEVWSDQPARPLTPAVAHGPDVAGRDAAEKRAEAARAIDANGAAATVLTAPDSIAWLLNIRGGDLPNTPVTLCFAILAADGFVQLFMDQRKLPDATRRHLGNEVSVHPRDDFGDALSALGEAASVVQVSPGTAPAWVIDRLEDSGATILRKQDPCVLPKACKNAVELTGTRNAHIRDGAALCRFLSWLSVEAPKGTVDELGAVDRLYAFRAAGERFRGLSFDTISGAGSNGAIVHYHSTPETNRLLEPGTLFLVDSGAQYLDGTTDVTRTVAIGTPTAEMRDRFTRVLKGHIAVATARFPAGTSGGQLDTLARHALWQEGLDFDHGTGHGVGSYLGVHEGPQRISKRFGDVPLRPGMILSNEPGYYKAGAYGIRIENLEVVRTAEKGAEAEREMLGFEALTLAPIDLALVDTSIMNAAEIDWLNRYHARVHETIGPLVDDATGAWLESAARPVSTGPES
ncbi:MAG: aminopeptidase P family protein [Rhodospirillaceae bacterium]|nr:aminopeptidase P family protein [Rhodospirillaceae bacterium]MBT5455834.1 aminopeptidase P family protein [Rhodospirillaceae bacterium]